MKDRKDPIQDLLNGPVAVVNIGLAQFARTLEGRGGRRGPGRLESARGRQPADDRSSGQARCVMAGDVAAAVEAANTRAVERMLAADPVLVDVAAAGDAIEGLEDRTILHAGPPIGWPDMCGPAEGRRRWRHRAGGLGGGSGRRGRTRRCIGGVGFHPNHHFDTVGPMTGIVTRSMPVMIVENRAFGNRAFCTLNEGLGKVMRFGGNDAEVLARLRWLAGHVRSRFRRGLAGGRGNTPQGDDRARALDGRRDAPAQCRLHQPSSAHDRARARARRR